MQVRKLDGVHDINDVGIQVNGRVGEMDAIAETSARDGVNVIPCLSEQRRDRVPDEGPGPLPGNEHKRRLRALGRMWRGVLRGGRERRAEVGGKCRSRDTRRGPQNGTPANALLVTRTIESAARFVAHRASSLARALIC
jgi:hypothetical protein